MRTNDAKSLVLVLNDAAMKHCHRNTESHALNKARHRRSRDQHSRVISTLGPMITWPNFQVFHGSAGAHHVLIVGQQCSRTAIAGRFIAHTASLDIR